MQYIGRTLIVYGSAVHKKFQGIYIAKKDHYSIRSFLHKKDPYSTMVFFLKKYSSAIPFSTSTYVDVSLTRAGV